MTAQSDPYVRVYYRIVDDPKFADVYEDSATLGTWLKLLLQADAFYPSAATLPQGVKASLVDRLVTAGLVDILPNRRYRMHGLAAEREARSEHARRAARAKHEQDASNPRASTPAAISEPLRTEPIQSAPNRASPSAREKTGSKNLDEERDELMRRLKADALSSDMRNAMYARIEQIDNQKAAH